MFHLGFHKNATSFVSNWFMGFPPFFIKWLKGGQTGRGSREREREREREKEGAIVREREKEGAIEPRRKQLQGIKRLTGLDFRGLRAFPSFMGARLNNTPDENCCETL
jgi:hypothetical protein